MPKAVVFFGRLSACCEKSFLDVTGCFVLWGIHQRFCRPPEFDCAWSFWFATRYGRSQSHHITVYRFREMACHPARKQLTSQSIISPRCQLPGYCPPFWLGALLVNRLGPPFHQYTPPNPHTPPLTLNISGTSPRACHVSLGHLLPSLAPATPDPNWSAPRRDTVTAAVPDPSGPSHPTALGRPPDGRPPPAGIAAPLVRGSLFVLERVGVGAKAPRSPPHAVPQDQGIGAVFP